MGDTWSNVSDYFWPPPKGPSLQERLIDNATFNKDLGNIASQIYPFENLVLEGGGAKGIAYAGVLKVLEKTGIWKKLKRYAGTSAGAIVVCLLAVGYTPEELLDILADTDLNAIAVDDPSTFMSTVKFGLHVHKLFNYLGWNSGNKMFEWLGEKIEKKTGNKYFTFRQLFIEKGKELCIVVTNVSLMTVEYLHVKTAPNQSIRTAVRMSMSIPVFFEAVKGSSGAHEDLYVDGGMLANYPIKCYDGWWLSMAIRNNFLTKLQPLTEIGMIAHRKDRFGIKNNKTIGVLLCAKGAEGVFNSSITLKDPIPKRPDTKLAREQTERENRSTSKINIDEPKLLEASNTLIEALMESLKDSGREDAVAIDRKCLETALQTIKDDECKRKQAVLLFGEDWDVSSVLDKLTVDDHEEITFDRLVTFAEKHGLDAKCKFYGHARKEIRGFRTYLGRLTSMMLTNTQRLHFEVQDVKRSIIVNVDYIGTLDFNMEVKDKEFAVEQGAKATIDFLEDYIKKKAQDQARQTEDLVKVNTQLGVKAAIGVVEDIINQKPQDQAKQADMSSGEKLVKVESNESIVSE